MLSAIIFNELTMVDVEKLLGALIVTLRIWWSHTFVVFMTRRLWMAMKKLKERGAARRGVWASWTLHIRHDDALNNPPHSSEWRDIRSRKAETSVGRRREWKHGRKIVSFHPSEGNISLTYLLRCVATQWGKLFTRRVGSCCDNFHIENISEKKRESLSVSHFHFSKLRRRGKNNY